MLLLAHRPRRAARNRIAPHIGYVYPAGGRQGTTFQVTVGGQFLDGVDQRATSPARGIQAKVVDYVKPHDAEASSTSCGRSCRNCRRSRQTRGRQGNRRASGRNWPTFVQPAVPAPRIAETATLQVTRRRRCRARAARAAADERRKGCRIRSCFTVGQLPEFVEAAGEVRGLEAEAHRRSGGRRVRGHERHAAGAATAACPVAITLPAIVNGQIMPGDVDRYRFQARKGQQLVVAVSARELIPYLADAVPGWFQATPSRSTMPRANEVAYDDDYRFHPDPVALLTRFPTTASTCSRSRTPSTAAARISSIASPSASCRS